MFVFLIHCHWQCISSVHALFLAQYVGVHFVLNDKLIFEPYMQEKKAHFPSSPRSRHSCSASLHWCDFSVVKLTFSFRQTPSWLWLVRTNSPVFTPPGNGPVGTNNGRTPPYYGHASSQRIPRLYHIQVWLTVLWCNTPLKTNRESRLIEFFVFVNFQRTVRFGSLQSFTVHKIGDFSLFLSWVAGGLVLYTQMELSQS